MKHLVDSTNFWADRQGKHLVLLGYLYQTTEPIAAWNDIRPLIQTCGRGELSSLTISGFAAMPLNRFSSRLHRLYDAFLVRSAEG